MEYNDFMVTIEKNRAKGYIVKAQEKFPNGEPVQIRGQETFKAGALLSRLPIVTGNITSAILGDRHDDNLIRQFGRDLFNELIKGKIRDGFQHALSVARANNPIKGLRIRLQLPSELQVIPWELMYRTDVVPEHFLCLNAGIALVRSNPQVGKATALAIQLPLSILVVAATPLDHTPLEARKEIDSLLTALADLIQSGRVRVDFVHGADTLPRVIKVALSNSYHILHFVGHGEEDAGQAYLLFEDDERNANRLTPLNLYLALAAVNLPRMVFLNVCQGARILVKPPVASIAESFLRSGIPAVIAHQFEVSDMAAGMFARHLYRSLSGGMPVDNALVQTRMLADQKLKASIESLTPVIYLHNANGELFPINFAATEPAPPVADLAAHARIAAAASHWSEAADYAREALIIQSDNAEAEELLKKGLAEEEMFNCLHEANYETRLANLERVSLEDQVACLEKAAGWYEKYVECHKQLGHPPGELERITQGEQEVQTKIEQLKQAEHDRIDQLNQLDQLKRQIAQVDVFMRDPRLMWKG